LQKPSVQRSMRRRRGLGSVLSMHYPVVHQHRGLQLVRVPGPQDGLGGGGADGADKCRERAQSRHGRVDSESATERGRRRARTGASSACCVAYCRGASRKRSRSEPSGSREGQARTTPCWLEVWSIRVPYWRSWTGTTTGINAALTRSPRFDLWLRQTPFWRSWSISSERIVVNLLRLGDFCVLAHYGAAHR
jgi:hypothetical protein